jgi:hypothetical protein
MDSLEASRQRQWRTQALAGRTQHSVNQAAKNITPLRVCNAATGMKSQGLRQRRQTMAAAEQMPSRMLDNTNPNRKVQQLNDKAIRATSAKRGDWDEHGAHDSLLGRL